uniref:hypothetical protein n=1 Tax=Paenarthrobacter ureafaciens TaxID=37931 RepID=UPI003F499C1E
MFVLPKRRDLGNMSIRKVVLSAATTLLTISALAACGGASATPQSTFDATGKLEDNSLKGSTCTSQNASVLKTGNQVKIQTNGNTVAMGEVGLGRLDDRSPNDGYVCVFDFKVSGVPTGQGFYRVVVEGQGAKEVSEVDLKSGTFTVNTTKLEDQPN